MFSYVAMEKRKRGMVETGKGSGRKDEGKERKRLEGEMQPYIENENENEKNSETMRPSHIEADNPQHPIADNPQHPVAENASPRLVSSPVEEEEDTKTWRVLQTPIKRDQHVLVDVCSPEGTLERRVFSKRKMKDDLEKYRLIRKAEWGGELSLCTVWFNKHNIRSQELASLFLVLLLLSNTQLLLRHVDTVQELTDILVAHQHAQVDLRSYSLFFQRKKHTRNRHGLDVVSLKDDLILLSLGLGDRHAFLHMDVAHTLLTKEVTDLHLGTVLVDGNVDGEVSVHETHLVAVSVSHTGDHVADVRANRSDHRDVLVQSEPEIHEHLVSLLADVHKLVGEIAVQSTTRSLHDHSSVLDENGH